MRKYMVIGGFWMGIVLLNAVGWNSVRFCDWYVSNVFPLWVESYGRMTGRIPFSVGELMLVCAAALLLLLLFAGLASVLWKLAGHVRKGSKVKAPKWCRRYGFSMLALFTAVALVMTLNCFLLYHCTSFSEKYMGCTAEKEYSRWQLEALRNHIVEKCNELSKLVDRDAGGIIKYKGDLEARAVEEMERLGQRYPQLAGYYPDPKQFYMSDFFSQQHMQGYYFPFSMEANYNNRMYVTNMPITICHELSHLKGFIQEDEANFIAFLACTGSEDVLFQYSGYLSVLYYIDNDYLDAIDGNREHYRTQVAISSLVRRDKVFLTPEAWEEVEKKAVISTDTVSKVSRTFLETNLALNGVEDGMVAYSRVAELILEYYDTEERFLFDDNGCVITELGMRE